MIEATAVLQEGRRIIDAARGAGLTVRLLGGVAVRVHAVEPVAAAFERAFADIDVATCRGDRKYLPRLFADLGYEPSETFNALNRTRMVFYQKDSPLHVDVFVDEFRLCHRLEFGHRLGEDPLTIPLADLLLTKLQIVRVNPKDQSDIFALLADHEVGDHDTDVINGPYIARLCAHDWGLCRTVTKNLARARDELAAVDLRDGVREQLTDRLDALSSYIELEPKSRGWRLRDRVGERKRWYEEPEEIAHPDE